MEENIPNPSPGEEKEDGELEDGELEEDEDEAQAVDGENRGEAGDGGGSGPALHADTGEDAHHDSFKKEGDDGEDGKKKEGKTNKDEKKRKHKEDDEEREKRRKKKKKRKHVSSEEEEEEDSQSPKFHRKMIAPTFDSNMGFDAMLQQEMFLRGRSPPPGMVPFTPPPPGPFGPGAMFRGRPMSDYDSYDSESDSEMRRHERRRRRRHRRSRSRSRSPSRKNEAICMYYMQGSCQKGKACPYSHDIQPQRKMELCKFYMMDCCAKKEKCLYMHKDFPCKYYHTGLRCKLGTKCKFSHGHLGDSSRQILLKHIELAPKDILGDFPRLTKEAAQLVVSMTEAHRRGQPLTIDNIPGIMDMKGRGFKYVDKAIKAFEKKQEKLREQEEQDCRERMEFDEGGHCEPLNDAREEDRTPKLRKDEPKLEKKSPEHAGHPPQEENEVLNGEMAQSSMGGNASQANLSPSRKLGFMARMPQKQRELFQRIEQQHAMGDDHDDNVGEAGGSQEPGNVNWYSSDEDGEGAGLSRHHSQMGRNSSPSRTPPLPSHGRSTTPPRDSHTPPGRPEESQGPDAPSATSPKMNFSNINLASINISSDLASVLSALKNQNSSNRSSEETNRRQHLESPKKDQRGSGIGNSMENENLKSPQQSRGPRDVQASRFSSEYPANPWMRDEQSGSGRWDSSGDIDLLKEGRGIQESKDVFDIDQRQRTGDIDLRVLPGIENNQPHSVEGNKQDTDMRVSSEPSIYDVDLRQLGLPNVFKESDDDSNSLPFKVPMHTPAKEIVASISSHSPMYYQLVKVCVPKPNFSHLKVNKDDPKILEDPRLRRMLRRNSNEDNPNRSPRAPSRYELDCPLSPTPVSTPTITENPNKSSDSDKRDPRVAGGRDPRSEPRVDPRSEPRGDPRGDPRVNNRADPRMGNRGDPRGDARDPRPDHMNDTRNPDPRMFPGGNNSNVMDGGMGAGNMGPGGMGGGMASRNTDPRGRPGLLGPAPVPFGAGSHNMGSQMSPFMMGQMGPNQMGNNPMGPKQIGHNHMGPNQMGPNQMGPNQMGPNQMGPNQMGPNQIGPNQMGPNQMGPNQMGPNQMGPNQMGPNHMGPNQMGPNHMGPNQMGPNHMGPNQMGPNQMGLNQMGPNQMGPNQMGPNQMGPNQMGPSQMGPNQMGPNQLGPNQMGPNQMGPNQIGPNQMGPNQMGLNQMGPNQMGPNHMGPNQMGLNHMGPNQMGMNQMGPNQMGPGPNQMGPNGGYYNDGGGDMMGGGGFPHGGPGGPGWGNRMPHNDPRLKRDFSDGRSYTPPPVS